MRLQPGQTAPGFSVTDIQGQSHQLEDYRGKRLLLSFHRYAACPLCNLHIHELSQHAAELQQRGLQILAVFMSQPDRVSDQYSSRQIPFPIAADPERKMYAAYGVEHSVTGMLTAFLHPRAIKAVASGFLPGVIDADTTTLPADFLIGPDLRIAETYYSTNITQHMPLSRILEFARSGD